MTTDWREIPLLVVRAMTDEQLLFHLKKVKRMRRGYTDFGIKERVAILSRKDAIIFVEREMMLRKIGVRL